MATAPIAFVAGATGYTGREVVKQLVARGARAVAHVRPDSSSLAAWRERFAALGAEVDTTPWEASAMQSRLTALGPSLVFALLGTTRHRMKQDQSSYESVDYGLTALLIRAATALEPRPKFIYLSSMGVGPGARGAYLRARQRAEEELAGSGLPYLIARPSFITGEDRDEARPGERAAAAAADGILSALGRLGAARLRDRYRSTDAATLARALVGYALDDGAVDRVLSSDQLVRYGR